MTKYFVEYTFYNTSGDYPCKDETFNIYDSLDEIASLIVFNQHSSDFKVVDITKLVEISKDEERELATLIVEENEEQVKKIEEAKERIRKEKLESKKKSDEIQRELYLALKAKFETDNDIFQK